jgi:hypothetical protein
MYVTQVHVEASHPVDSPAARLGSDAPRPPEP